MAKTKQTERVYQYIKDFGSITQFEAMRDLGVMRLASRICDLKKQGVNIKDEFEAVQNRYGEPVHIKRYSFGDVA